MSDEKENKFHKVDQDPTKIDFEPKDLRKVPKSLWEFIKNTLSIKDEVDTGGTTASIKDDIEFKGINVWVLIFSILIASIGLNVNSVAVIIGAMLISPLMGPIRGVGLAVATNDFKLLMKSLINFGLMTGISLFVSWLYFLISPIKEFTPEMLARTEIIILDVFIAIFGGLAGIIAATKKGNTPFTVISGVAIATALMPPLCTVGAMLANIGEHHAWIKGLSALYLYLINSIFICFATIVVLRYLSFPLVEFLNPKTEKRVKRYIYGFMLLIIIPSGFKFYSVMQESRFRYNAKRFKESVIDKHPAHLSNHDFEFKPEGNDSSYIVLEFKGKSISEELRLDWERQAAHNYKLEKTGIKVIRDEQLAEQDTTLGADYYLKREEDLRLERDRLQRLINTKNKTIDLLKTEVDIYSRYGTNIPKLEKKIKFDFPEIKRFDYCIGFESNLFKRDTVVIFIAEWKDSVSSEKQNRMKEWLEIETDRKNIRLINQ